MARGQLANASTQPDTMLLLASAVLLLPPTVVSPARWPRGGAKYKYICVSVSGFFEIEGICILFVSGVVLVADISVFGVFGAFEIFAKVSVFGMFGGPQTLVVGTKVVEHSEN